MMRPHWIPAEEVSKMHSLIAGLGNKITEGITEEASWQLAFDTAEECVDELALDDLLKYENPDHVMQATQFCALILGVLWACQNEQIAPVENLLDVFTVVLAEADAEIFDGEFARCRAILAAAFDRFMAEQHA